MSTRPTTRYRLAAVAFLAPLLLPGTAHGATFYVNDLSDGPDANPDCICDTGGGPAGGAVCTLRAAVQEANTCQTVGPPHDIDLPAGNYILSLAGFGPDKGDLDVVGTGVITNIHGYGANVTVISASALADRIFDVDADAILFIENLTLRNATHAGDGGLVYNAGTFDAFAVEMDNGTTSLGIGGAVYNSGTALLDDCNIHHNSAYDYGGALYNTGTMTVVDSTIEKDALTASTSYAGALYNAPGATADILGGSIYGHTAATDGGALNNSGSMSLTGVEVMGNTATGGYGGAVYNSGIALLDDCNIHDNSAYVGGGVFNWDMMTVRSSTVSSNYASNSGGRAVQLRGGYRRNCGRQLLRELGRQRRCPVQPRANVAFRGASRVQQRHRLRRRDPVLLQLGRPTHHRG